MVTFVGQSDTDMAGRRPSVPEEDILEYFTGGEDPAYGTTELADALGYSQAGMHKRLIGLRKAGLLRSKDVGSSLIWWLSPKGESHLDE